MGFGEKYEPFDPEDPFNAAADEIRVQVVELASKGMKSEPYSKLESYRQVECFMAGVMTGLVGVCFCHIRDEGRDEMMKAIESYLPHARANAEEMIKGAPLAKGMGNENRQARILA